MSINFKLAYQELLRNKKDTRITLILAGVIFTLLLSIVNISDCYQTAIKQKQLQDAGKWIYYIENVSYQNYKTIAKNNQETAIIQSLGTLGSNSVISVSDNFGSLVNFDLVEGNYPKTGEIALTKTILNTLGYQGKIGEKVTIHYDDSDGQRIEVSAKLSGVVKKNHVQLIQNDFNVSSSSQMTISSGYEMRFGDIILPLEQLKNTVSLYVYDQDLVTKIKENAYNQGLFLRLPKNSDNWVIIHNDGYQSTAIQTFMMNIIKTLMIGGCMLICLIIMVGITLSSLPYKTKGYALLRAIGQTKRQMVKMQLYMLFLISSIALVIALAVSYLISYLGVLIIQRLISLDAGLNISQENYLGMIFCGLIIIFMGMSFPGIQSYKKALTGEFDEKVFDRFSISYRKLKYQNIFQLAKRGFSKNKWSNMVLVIVLAVTFIAVNNVIIAFKEYSYCQDESKQTLNNNEITLISDFADEEYQFALPEGGFSEDQLAYFKSINDKIYYSKYARSYDEYYSWNDVVNSKRKEVLDYFDEGIFSHRAINFYAFKKDSDGYDLIKQTLEGRMPRKANEVVVYLPYIRDIDNEFVLGDEFTDSNIEINEIIKVYQGPDKPDLKPMNYQVVGIIHELSNNKILKLEPMSLIVYESEFNRKFDYLDPRLYNNIYIRANNKAKTLAKINEFNLDNNLIVRDFSSELRLQESSLKNDFLKAVSYSLVMLGISLFIFAYLSRYRLIGQSQQIGVLRLIGSTRFQIYGIFIIQILMICLGAHFIAGWNIIYMLTFENKWSYPYLLFTGISIFITLIITGIYCIPLRKILKQDILEITKINN